MDLQKKEKKLKQKEKKLTGFEHLQGKIQKKYLNFSWKQIK